MNTTLRQQTPAESSLRPLITASEATISSRASLIDRVTMRVALRLLLWSARRASVPDARPADRLVRRAAGTALDAHRHEVERERLLREIAWERARHLDIHR